MKNFARPLSRLILISFTWGSLAVLVALAHSSTAYAAEPICNRGDILLCEDWADGDHKGWDWNSQWDAGGQYKIVDVGGIDDRNALKVRIPENARDTIFPDHRIADQQGKTYLRFYIEYSSGFLFNPGWAGGKVAYLRSNAPVDQKWRIEIGLRGKENNTKGWLHVDLRHMESLDPNQSVFLYNNQGNNIDIESGQWYAVELMVKPNTPGAKDGEIKLWINGTLQMHHTGQNLRGNRTAPINDVWLTSYFGGAATIHPEQWVWYDNIVASTNYIGPFPKNTDTTPPVAPSGLRVE